MQAKTFDHVALWASQRDDLADLLTECCDMHVIERTDAFTLVGGDAREGKLTLFEVDDERAPGILERVVLRVPRLEDAQRRLRTHGVETHADGDVLAFRGPGDVPLGLIEEPGVESGDLRHVVLGVPDPDATASDLSRLVRGEPNGHGGRVEIANREIVLTHSGGGADDDRSPLLNHLAVLVDDAASVAAEARELGLEIDREVDAANTFAVFVVGPEGILLEYVEHKPGFALV